MSVDVVLANVLAHCGGDRERAARYLSRAIAAAPSDAEVYAAAVELLPTLGELPGNDATVAPLLAFAHFLDGRLDDAVVTLGALSGVSPHIPWADAPWFADVSFLSAVSIEAVREAVCLLFDHAAVPEDAAAVPWSRAIETITARPELGPEDFAGLAISLRLLGRTDESLALCDRADRIGRTMLTEVVRGGTWRLLGNLDESAAAFHRALALEPDNWSLYLDLSDLHAERGDHPAALAVAQAGLTHAPNEPKLLAARAAHHARLTGTAAALREFDRLAPDIDPAYSRWLRDQATGAD
ncbi:tetratricopeptide repeat protein [Nocardia sp. CDC153]|uniref:tetratricopeptide repeat protein n=1 Tax=Nocardia sp. CDC153 TaxID=3112167 RepID=UPI002DBE6D7A|nr:tetratricopeptide repeat protein [Nocardia sp. CDC153]MEC3953133.1 tetratricopeptide repeat protein [Nocardia sp. CDC153]